jgi:hypothetical protein
MTRLACVNDSDLYGAIRAGCQTMGQMFNADDDGVPFFGSTLYPEARLSFSPYHSESHVPGRHLNALLTAEAVAPDDSADHESLDDAVAGHRRALMRSYSGALPLPLNRQQQGDMEPVNFCPHNLREGFHGLHALIRHRNDEPAEALAEASIAAIGQLWHPARGWDEASLQAQGLHFQACQSFVHGEARMLGPLVKLHRATGSSAALRLAEDVAEKLLREVYLEDGAFTAERFGAVHAHSITCCLSSLAQFADLQDDHALMRRVQAFYDHGLWAMRDTLGWSPEAVQQTGSDHGEANNTGDIVETALLLGARGWPAYYHDAERILRTHLLPSQLLDTSFVQQPDNPNGVDGLRDVARRHHGAWGFPAPYGHQPAGQGRGNLSFNMDIVGGVVGSLCAALDAVVASDDVTHHIRMLLAHETDGVKLEVPYGSCASGEVLLITVKRAGALRVQLPPWIDEGQLRIDPPGASFLFRDGALHIEQPPVGTVIRVHFPLPTQELTLTHHHDSPIDVRLRGDRVEAMDGLGANLTFFPELRTPTRL